jgi:hypothetical protein
MGERERRERRRMRGEERKERADLALEVGGAKYITMEREDRG